MASKYTAKPQKWKLLEGFLQTMLNDEEVQDYIAKFQSYHIEQYVDSLKEKKQ